MFIVPVNGMRKRVKVSRVKDLKEIPSRVTRYKVGKLLKRNFGNIVVMSYRDLILDMRHGSLSNVTICMDNGSISETFLPEIKRKCLRYNYNLLFM